MSNTVDNDIVSFHRVPDDVWESLQQYRTVRILPNAETRRVIDHEFQAAEQITAESFAPPRLLHLIPQLSLADLLEPSSLKINIALSA
jgi:hypothetical protein